MTAQPVPSGGHPLVTPWDGERPGYHHSDLMAGLRAAIIAAALLVLLVAVILL